MVDTGPVIWEPMESWDTVGYSLVGSNVKERWVKYRRPCGGYAYLPDEATLARERAETEAQLVLLDRVEEETRESVNRAKERVDSEVRRAEEIADRNEREARYLFRDIGSMRQSLLYPGERVVPLSRMRKRE